MFKVTALSYTCSAKYISDISWLGESTFTEEELEKEILKIKKKIERLFQEGFHCLLAITDSEEVVHVMRTRLKFKILGKYDSWKHGEDAVAYVLGRFSTLKEYDPDVEFDVWR